METPHNKKKTKKPWTRPKSQDSDGAYGRLFRNRHIFLQLLKSFVDLDFVRELRPQDLELADSRHYLPDLKRRESDVIWKITGRKASGRKAGQWYFVLQTLYTTGEPVHTGQDHTAPQLPVYPVPV